MLSGLFVGADSIKDRAAIVVAPDGKGQIVMFATNPVWRWQNLGEYRMMFNTLMNYKNLTPGPLPAADKQSSKEADKDSDKETESPQPSR